MKTVIIAMLLALPVVAHAEDFVYQRLDAFSNAYSDMIVTGVRQNASDPEIRTFVFSGSTQAERGPQMAACQQMALLAMNRPGRYLFAVQNGFNSVQKCTLTRQP